MDNEVNISNMRMLRHIFDASVSGLVLTSWASISVLLIFLWPLALLISILQFLILLIMLPVIFTAIWPLSLVLYRRKYDSPFIWIGSFLIVGLVYFVALMVVNNQTLEGAALLF